MPLYFKKIQIFFRHSTILSFIIVHFLVSFSLSLVDLLVVMHCCTVMHFSDSLKDLFESLGFLVEIKKDQTVSAMKMTLKQYSESRQHGDCFVCCVLSHGDESGVVGYDEQRCPVDDITSPFNGVNCPSLVGKPKVFFIQACRGHGIQSKVMVADCIGGSHMQKPGRVSYSIPKDSDFLIAKSTVEGYVSIRDEIRGSWFIQSLCENLKEGSKR